MSETIYTVDKTGWPAGPWITEPDKLNWVDKESNLDCMIIRTDLGHLCGYVGVTEAHRLFGKSTYEADETTNVHGGITFADKCSGHICHVPEPGRPDHVWWFGFDCAHAWDFSPGMDRAVRLGNQDVAYRDIDYVKAEVTKLAQQLVG